MVLFSIKNSFSWRASGLKYMRNIWKDRDYKGEIIDITPNEQDLVKVKYGLFEFYDDVKGEMK